MAFTIMNLPLIPQENVLGYLNLDDVMCFEVACRGFECDANGVSTILQHRKLEKMIFKYRPHTFPFAALSSLFSSVRRCDFSAQSVKAEHLPLFRGIANLEAVSFDCCEELLPEDLESFFASFSSLKYISINNVFPVCESVQLPVLKSIQGHHPKLTALSLQGYGDFMLLAGNIIGSMHELQQLSIAHCQPEDILEFNRESCLQNLWFLEIGPPAFKAPMYIADLLEWTVKLESLEVLSIYNMTISTRMSQERILSFLNGHKKLKKIFSYSCSPALKYHLSNICEELSLDFELKGETKFKKIEDID